MSQRKRSSETSKPLDYYKVLAVSRTAKVAEIKQVYRALAWEHHPDRGGDPAVMAQYTEAWSVLRDAKKRKELDALLKLFSKPCGQCKGTGVSRSIKGFGGAVREYECDVCGGTGELE